MKEQILAALRTKYKNLGLSEKAFESVALFLENTVTSEDQIETATSGVEPILKGMQGEADKVRTESAKKYQELEKTIPKKEAGAAEPKKEEDKKEDVPEYVKILLERLDKIEGSKVLDSRKQKLETAISKLPSEMRGSYSRYKLDAYNDEEFDSLLTEVSGEVETVSATLAAKGAVFSTPVGGGGVASKTASEKELKEAAKMLKI